MSPSGGWVRVIEADCRIMLEVETASVDLVVTSPPYWHLKDYGVPEQIGYGQTLHEYLRDLYRVWREVFRVLRPGRRLCINIGDQFARAAVYGRYKVIPLHAEVIAQCERIGFDYMGAIIWQKRTTMHTTGGATVMGSYPYPPNGIVEIDYEYILIFKKPGRSSKVSPEVKQASKMTKEEWKTYFSGHWNFGGAQQVDHEAVFPSELPRRLIRMFSFVGETVLDPFAGSGTTLVQAAQLGRSAIGYEINPRFVELIRERLAEVISSTSGPQVTFEQREQSVLPVPVEEYTPSIQDAQPQIAPDKLRFGPQALYRVRQAEASGLLTLDTGLQVSLLGVDITDPQGFVAYAKRYLQGRQVFLKFDRAERAVENATRVRAYVYLKNKIFVNAYLLKAGLARPSNEPHYLAQRFIELWREHQGAQHG